MKLLLTLSLLAGATLSAQVDSGAISGTVRDASGAVVQNAAITVQSESTNFKIGLLSNAEGFYAAPALRPGLYRITAAAPGFRIETRTGVELRVQERLSVEFVLEPSQSNTQITVLEQAEILESQTTSGGHVVQDRTIRELPLNGRSLMQLGTLGTGTSPARTGSERDTFVANGNRPVQNSYLLDGAENKNKIVGFDNSTAQVISPVIDGVQEFKVQTSTFSAEFGQSAGAVVNVTLKSGTNQLHGSAFEFLRNSVFDAKPYFQPTNTTPGFIQNQFGATLGGPIRKDQTFFFASWQDGHEVNAAPQTTSVPINSYKAGQFTSNTYDPATTRLNAAGTGYIRDLFPGNQVPKSRWDPVAANLVTLYPDANLPGLVSNYFYNPRERTNSRQINVRADHRQGERDSFFVRVSTSDQHNTLPAALPPPASDASQVYPIGRSYVGSYSHIFRPNLTNEARFAYMYTQVTQQVDSPRRFEEFGIQGTVNDAVIRGLPTFTITGLSTLGTTGPGSQPTPATGSGNLPIDKQGHVIQFKDNLAWVRGRHTIKTGVDIQQVTLYAFVTLQARPDFSFTGVFTQNPASRAGSGAPFADFLLGYTNSATVSTRSRSESQQHIIQGYLQDDWAVTARLTLNLGLRYEFTLPWFETTNRYANFVLDAGPQYGQLITSDQAVQAGLDRSFVDKDLNNFAPRVGAAYRAGSKTVIRGAFGTFYGRDENLAVATRPTNNPPNFVKSTFPSDQINPYITLSGGFPPNAVDPATVKTPDVNSFPRSFPLPYVLQWNFNVQHELPGGFALETGYLGSVTRKLYRTNSVNLPTPGPGAIAARRPFQTVGNITLYAPLLKANFNSWQTQIERRFRNGFSFSTAYTWSHSIDEDGSSDPRNLASNRGNSNFDVPHRLVVSYIYELPFGRSKKLLHSGIGAVLAGGWQVSGVTAVQSGLPITPTLNFDPTNTGATVRPNRLSDGSLPSDQRSIQRWFDVSAFVAPTAAYTFGNSGRNILRGPRSTNFDVSVARRFTLSERFGLQFRGEAFNLFNTPQFGLPASTIGNPSAGVITSVVTPERQIQLALKLNF